MSGNVYVAFEASNEPGNLYMIYDDGYIFSHLCGTVYSEIE
jgi:hypothetical protein